MHVRMDVRKGAGMYRQGDVLLVNVDEVPDGLERHRSRSVVLALGEVTGHAHRLRGEVEVHGKKLEALFVQVLHEGGVLTHEEHGTIPVPPGTYRVFRQREYEPEGIRFVAD